MSVSFARGPAPAGGGLKPPSPRVCGHTGESSLLEQFGRESVPLARLEAGCDHQGEEKQTRGREVRRRFARHLERRVAPHGADRSAEAFHRARRALTTAL